MRNKCNIKLLKSTKDHCNKIMRSNNDQSDESNFIALRSAELPRKKTKTHLIRGEKKFYWQF